MPPDALDGEVAALGRAVAATAGLLAGSLLVGAAAVGPAVALLSDAGVPADLAARAGVTLGALVAPVAFLAARVRHARRGGLRSLLAGLALAGASLGALWLTSPALSAPAAVPPAVAATYVLGLAAIAGGHVAARLAPADTGSARGGAPSYVREEPERVVPPDGGSADDDLTFPLDDDER